MTPPIKRLSRTCRSNKLKPVDGFTLIELIVVMSLIGVMLGFAAPQLRNALFVDSTKKVSRWFMITIPATKTKALREQKLMALGISFDQDKVWITSHQPSNETESLLDLEDEDESDEEDDQEEVDSETLPEKTIEFEFPADVQIMDVEFPDQDRISVGETEIYFYPKGYSDHAIIHIEDDDGERYSFLIEPFLPNVKRIDDYVRF